mmetsp:Transcript_49142/g.54945  ORF Transcript_49142/g.54945 Transcript_49142/m.54945 type:complete len:85 (+) Transcript_49142:1139-1393(+)
MLARFTATPKVSSGPISNIVPPQSPLGNGGVSCRLDEDGDTTFCGGIVLLFIVDMASELCCRSIDIVISRSSRVVNCDIDVTEI